MAVRMLPYGGGLRNEHHRSFLADIGFSDCGRVAPSSDGQQNSAPVRRSAPLRSVKAKTTAGTRHGSYIDTGTIPNVVVTPASPSPLPPATSITHTALLDSSLESPDIVSRHQDECVSDVSPETFGLNVAPPHGMRQDLHESDTFEAAGGFRDTFIAASSSHCSPHDVHHLYHHSSVSSTTSCSCSQATPKETQANRYNWGGRVPGCSRIKFTYPGWPDPADREKARGESVHQWPDSMFSQTLAKQKDDRFAAILRDGSYFTPWELRDKSVGCTEHGPKCVRQVDGATLREQVGVVASPLGFRHHARVRSEPVVQVRPPQPDRRMSSLAQGLQGLSATVGADRNEESTVSDKALVGGCCEEANLRIGLATEWDEIQQRMSRSTEQPREGWLSHFFWEYDNAYFEPAMEELRRTWSRTKLLASPQKSQPGSPRRQSHDVESRDPSFSDELLMPLGSPVWRGIKWLTRSCVGWVADEVSQLGRSLRRAKHKLKHHLFDGPCTADCFTDAFERDSVLRDSDANTRASSYGTVAEVTETGPYLGSTSADPSKVGRVKRWKRRITDWIGRSLDGLDGTWQREHEHQARMDSETYFAAVAQLRKSRNRRPENGRQGGAYRWVQLPGHGWVYERYI